MKTIRTIAALVLFVAVLSAQESVAVLPPLADKNVSEMTKKVVRSAFSDYISAPGSGYTAYDRDHTDLLIKELGEQRSVLYDEKSAKELGTRIGVQYVCISELTKDESDFLIECKLINVETGAAKTESEFATKSTNDVVRKASIAAIKRLLGMGGEGKDMAAARTESVPTMTGRSITATPATTSKPSQVNPEDKEANNETVGQRNAVQKAKQYLNFAGFSRKGLIKQLERGGFTSEEAKYGADNVNADWMEQSARTAKQYLDHRGGFSRKSLIMQLEHAGFTNEEAKYGASAVGL